MLCWERGHVFLMGSKWKGNQEKFLKPNCKFVVPYAIEIDTSLAAFKIWINFAYYGFENSWFKLLSINKELKMSASISITIKNNIFRAKNNSEGSKKKKKKKNIQKTRRLKEPCQVLCSKQHTRT